MAQVGIQFQYESAQLGTVATAFAQIHSVHFEQNTIDVAVRIFFSRERAVATNLDGSIEQRTFPLTVETDEQSFSVATLHQYLMAQPFFVNAVAVEKVVRV